MIAIKPVSNYLLFLLALNIVACKKEAAPQPSNKEEFFLTVKDNPSDPVDHAIYEFYKATNLPLFYNDTVAREQVGDSAGIPIYSYQRLAVRYSPVGTQVNINFVLLSEKEAVLPMLPFIKDNLLPLIPDVFPLQSLLLVQSSSQRATGGLAPRKNKAFVGFNTLLLPTVNPETMSDSSKRKYIADVLATLAFKMLKPAYETRLAAEFHSITKSTTSSPLIYLQLLSSLSPDGNGTLEDFSFLPMRFIQASAPGYTPRPDDDLVSYIEVAFFYENYAPANFETDYAAYPLMIKKFKVVKKILKEIGFQIAG
jgi:hypothetical protein